MNKIKFIGLTIVFTGACAFLFNIFYKEAKNTAIAKLNEEQMIHAKQAARGIEDFFAMWTRNLNSLSKMDEIIKTDAVGKRYMKLLYEANQEQISSITRLDERGVILYNFPSISSVGTDISGQKHVRELLRDHKPVISDVFKAVEGFEAVALHVPVFRGSEFKGSIGILINFEGLAKRYIDVIKIGETGYSWVVSRDGTLLYSPISGFTGKSVIETMNNSPSLIVMVNDMLKGHEGALVYTLDGTGGRKDGQKREYAVYMPVHIGSTFWSVAVASSGQDVLSGLISFRNKLAFVIGSLFICGMVFSTLGAKAWFIVKEEEKRKRIEKKLQESEQSAEKFSTLFHATPFAMALATTPDGELYDVNQAWLDLAGFTRKEEVIGNSGVDLELIREVEPRDRILDEFRQQGSVRNAEVATYTNRGVHLTLLVNLDRVDIGGRKFILSSIQDITERKLVEEALRESEAKYRNLFANMTEEVHFWELVRKENGGIKTWRLVDANPPTLKTWGRTLDEIRGKTTDEIFGPGATDHYMQVVQKITTEGVPFSFEDYFPNMDKHFRFTSVPFGDFFITTGADITGIKKAQEELREAQRIAHIGSWHWDAKTDVTTGSNELLRIYGIDPAKESMPAFRDQKGRCYPAEEWMRVNEAVQQAMQTGVGYELDVQAIRNGTPIWITTRSEVIRDADGHIVHLRGTVQDITERKQAEEALKKLNDELETRVAERTEELAATIGKLQFEIIEREHVEERILRLNRLYMVLSETNQAIVRTKDRDTLFNDFCRIAVEDGGFKLAWVGLVDEVSGELKILAAKGATGYLEKIRITANKEQAGIGPTGISVREGTFYICNDFLGSPVTAPWHDRGRAHGIRASASIALKQEGRVIGALTLYADKKDFFDQQQVELFRQMGADISFALDNIARETHHREAERALHEETAERLRTMEALREKEQMLIQQSRQAAMGEMIGNIAHQWRQPLNALGLTIQQLSLLYEIGEFNRDCLDSSVQQSMDLIKHMSRTIEDFRNFFRPGKEKAEFKVREAIANSLSLVEDSFNNRHIGTEIMAKDDPVIFGYRNEFEQALLNILNNARDALTERKTRDPRVTIAIFNEEGRVVITVADNAGGILDEIMGKIFDPYFTTKGPQEGTGVGLFMSKTIIEKNMGGRLAARNSAAGAEFRIEL